MPMVMNLSAISLRMTLNECLVAATLNSAGSFALPTSLSLRVRCGLTRVCCRVVLTAALGVSADHGSLEVGKYGNFVLISNPIWEHLIYEIVDPPIERVVVQGKTVYQAPTEEASQQ